jgi:hypothetical protein
MNFPLQTLHLLFYQQTTHYTLPSANCSLQIACYLDEVTMKPAQTETCKVR